jgi:two-component system, NarL family, sensor kinase
MNTNSHLNFTLLICVLCILFLFVLWQFLWLKQKHDSYKQQTKHSQQSLQKSKKELLLLQGMLQGQHSERRRIAQSLHDQLAAKLSSIKLQLSIQNSSASNEHQRSLEKEIDSIIQEIRILSHQLMPETLLQFGLKKSLEDEVVKWNHQLAPLQFILVVQGDDKSLSTELQLWVFKTFTELVQNAIKHSGAEKIEIQLILQDPISLCVEDDGKGFSKGYSLGWGLKNIEQNVALLGGELEVQNLAKGSAVHVIIPKGHE